MNACDLINILIVCFPWQLLDRHSLIRCSKDPDRTQVLG